MFPRLTLSLNTKLVAGCMVMLGSSLLLSCTLIFIFGSNYVRADRNVVSLKVFERVLLAVSRVSAERGPMNALLGDEPDQVTSPARLQLADFRAKADKALDELLEPLPGSGSGQQDPRLLTAVAKVREALLEARVDMDALMALPVSGRSTDKIASVLHQMFTVVDLIRPIAFSLTARIIAEDQSLAGPAIIANMLSELRDFTGRLASLITPYIASRQPLPETSWNQIARMRERIISIWQLAGRQTGLYADEAHLIDLRQQVNAQYFGKGFQLIDSVAATGRSNGQFGITTKELMARYVTTQGSIDELRSKFLEAALNHLAIERTCALQWLIIVCTAAALIVAATVALISAGRYYVLQPLLIACDKIVALSAGETLPKLASPTNSHEMGRLFQALDDLRIILSERERHTEHLRVLSETDSLTGLLDRRVFDRIGTNDPEFADIPADITMILMDLDHFKAVNDTYGHIAGDLVLKHVADIVRQVCRQTDIVMRYGGEEIAIIIRDHKRRAALRVAERIRRELELSVVTLLDGRNINVTASFGVAQGQRVGEHWLTTVAAADEALYQAKASGRNQVFFAGDSHAHQASIVA